MRYYTTTGKLGAADREYRIHPGDGLQCKDHSGEWFSSHYTLQNLDNLIRWQFITRVK